MLGPLSFVLGIKVTQSSYGIFLATHHLFLDKSNRCLLLNLQTTPLRSLDGSLLYLALVTRLDIAFVFTRIGRLVSKPTESTWKMGLHILRYLKCTIDVAKAQRLTAKSTTEAELISLSHARKEIKWLRNIFAELNLAFCTNHRLSSIKIANLPL
eukprot:Awhi_evm1s5262